MNGIGEQRQGTRSEEPKSKGTLLRSNIALLVNPERLRWLATNWKRKYPEGSAVAVLARADHELLSLEQLHTVNSPQSTPITQIRLSAPDGSALTLSAQSPAYQFTSPHDSDPAAIEWAGHAKNLRTFYWFVPGLLARSPQVLAILLVLLLAIGLLSQLGSSGELTDSKRVSGSADSHTSPSLRNVQPQNLQPAARRPPAVALLRLMAFALLGFLIVFALSAVVRLILWLFPLCEFALGDGVDRHTTRVRLRWWLLPSAGTLYGLAHWFGSYLLAPF